VRIHTMTATFGKLEQEKLTLQPGMNIITGENEWGKSTWCAFLIAMFYGIDTRAKTTRQNLAEKERYAPWSGSPMSGRVDLTWKGRNITIERSTSGRVPMGQFRAYETESGLDIPELTAANCGEQLLGVERSVFLRSGFIRFSDLNVSDDEAFRRRLNNLVVTGDEHSEADHLAAQLKQLRSRIRYNRTGLLPQAEEERDRLEQWEQELRQLEKRQEMAQRRMDEADDWRLALENHLQALDYARNQELMDKIAEAEARRDQAREYADGCAAVCKALPDRDQAEEMLTQLRDLKESRAELQKQLKSAVPVENPRPLPHQFRNLDAREALLQAEEDGEAYEKLRKNRHFLAVLGVLLVVAGAVLNIRMPLPGLICCAVGVAVMLLALVLMILRFRKIDRMEKFYDSRDPQQWLRMAREYEAALYLHSPEAEQKRSVRQKLEQQLKELNGVIRQTTEERDLDECLQEWEEVLEAWADRDEAMLEYDRARDHLEAMGALLKPAQPPAYPDRLDYSRETTQRLLSECAEERRSLDNLSGQYLGRMEALGSRQELEQKKQDVSRRIAQLEQKYRALGIAMDTLNETTAELQRRFAPRITRRARELMARMTGGRYDKVSLNRDLTVQAGAVQENVLHEAQWRSDGTVDQLYLALRLAVAQELTPELPLILDDALVRFDDKRLKAALEILQEEAGNKQVILFTCQNRERNLM